MKFWEDIWILDETECYDYYRLAEICLAMKPDGKYLKGFDVEFTEYNSIQLYLDLISIKSDGPWDALLGIELYNFEELI